MSSIESVLTIITSLITTSMPVELTLQAAKWLQSLKVISGHQTLSNGRVSLLYNDQMYL